MRFGKSLGMWLVILALPVTASAGAGAGNPELLDAVKQGNKTSVRALLKQRADVKTPEADGTTALHWAVQADDLEMTLLLLRAGADVNAANRFGVTPLSLAATNGNAAMLEALIKAGASAKAALPQGETVLMTAARTGRADAIKLLLVNGAEVNAKESGLGETALMWAANENNADAVALLIEAGADVNARSAASPVPRLQYPRIGMIPADLPRGGWTALMYAARQGSIEAATKLADRGADLNVKDPAGSTALILAIINQQYDLAKLLLDKGADPNAADSTGMTPLYAAVDMHTAGWTQGRPQPKSSSELTSVDIAKALLAKGANPNSRLTSPILQRVHSRGDGSLGTGSTPFMRASKWGDMTMMRLLLDNGADPTLRQKNHTTALMIAAGVGKRVGGDDEEDPRQRGTEQDAINAIKLCIERGVDVNAFNDVGDTALHAAAGEALIKFLVESGAKTDAENRLKQTPLDVLKKNKGEKSAAAQLLAKLSAK